MSLFPKKVECSFKNYKKTKQNKKKHYRHISQTENNMLTFPSTMQCSSFSLNKADNMRSAAFKTIPETQDMTYK